MHLTADQISYLQHYLTEKLPLICQADPELLAKYVIALVRKDLPLDKLRENCARELEEFMKGGTIPFVNELFDEILKRPPFVSNSNTISNSGSNLTPVQRDGALTMSGDDRDHKHSTVPSSSSRKRSRSPSSASSDDEGRPPHKRHHTSRSHDRHDRRPVDRHERGSSRRGDGDRERERDRGRDRDRRAGQDHTTNGGVLLGGPSGSAVVSPMALATQPFNLPAAGTEGFVTPYAVAGPGGIPLLLNTAEAQAALAAAAAAGFGGQLPNLAGLTGVPPGAIALTAGQQLPEELMALAGSAEPRQYGGPRRGVRDREQEQKELEPYVVQRDAFDERTAGRGRGRGRAVPFREKGLERFEGRLMRPQDDVAGVGRGEGGSIEGGMSAAGPMPSAATTIPQPAGTVPMKRLHERGRGRGRGAPVEDPTNTTLCLRGVPEHQNQVGKLAAHFAKYGQVVNVAVRPEEKKAFVRFAKRDEAMAAYKSSEAVFGNRFIKMSWAKEALDEADMAAPPPAAPTAPAATQPPAPKPARPTVNVAAVASATAAAVEKLKTLKRQAEELRTKQMAQQKELVQRMEQLKKEPPGPTREAEQKMIAEQFNFLSEKIAESMKKEAEIAKKIKDLKLQAASAASGGVPPPAASAPSAAPAFLPSVAVAAEKERLDRELDLIRKSAEAVHTTPSQQGEGANTTERSVEDSAKGVAQPTTEKLVAATGDTTEPNAERLRELQEKADTLAAQAASMGLLAKAGEADRPPVPAYLGRGRARGRGRGVPFGRGRARGRGRGALAPPKGLAIDNRTTTLQITGLPEELSTEPAIRTHFMVLGDIVSVEVLPSRREALVKFATRKEAEFALAHGKTFKGNTLSLSWHEPAHEATPHATEVAEHEGEAAEEFEDAESLPEEADEKEERHWKR